MLAVYHGKPPTMNLPLMQVRLFHPLFISFSGGNEDSGSNKIGTVYGATDTRASLPFNYCDKRFQFKQEPGTSQIFSKSWQRSVFSVHLDLQFDIALGNVLVTNRMVT